jgi:hypothetical protein
MNLPEHDPRPDLWPRLAAELAADEQLARLVAGLPQHEPRADLWNALEIRLDEAKPQPRWQPIIRRNWYAMAGAVAASVLLAVGTWLTFSPKPTSERVYIEYAVEQQLPDKQATGDILARETEVTKLHAANNATEQQIEQHCRQKPMLACTHPDVVHLLAKLKKLNTEIARISRERSTFGPDQVLLRAQTDIERQRADVADALITRIRS